MTTTPTTVPNEIAELVIYMNSGILPPSIPTELNIRDLRLFLFSFLGWLHRQNAMKHTKCLDFPTSFVRDTARGVFASLPQLGPFFDFQGECIDFSASVPDSMRQSIRQYVDQFYKVSVRK